MADWKIYYLYCILMFCIIQRSLFHFSTSLVNPLGINGIYISAKRFCLCEHICTKCTIKNIGYMFVLVLHLQSTVCC